MDSDVHGLRYRQVDVFTDGETGGNGVAVFWDCPPGLPAHAMQALTIELRQFESVFLHATVASDLFRLRVFTMEEELDFAGHPLMGAAAVLHEKHGTRASQSWRFQLNASMVTVHTTRQNGAFLVTMDQAAPVFHAVDPTAVPTRVAASWIGLSPDDIDTYAPLEVVSTGLPYLLIPVTRGLSHARVAVPDLQEKLTGIGAAFLYVYDTVESEGRCWDNRGAVEDIATGSAAGPVAAYLCRHGRLAPGDELIIRQGRFVGRSSRIAARVRASGGRLVGVEVTGTARLVASGTFD